MGRRRTRVAAPADLTWGLYRFYDAGGELLYIGQSRRDQLARLIEHLRKQPWAGEIAGWWADPHVYTSETAALAAEREAIRREWPRYNDKHNHANPHRVVVRRSGARPSTAATARRTSRRPAHRRRGRVWWRRRSTWIAATWIAAAIALWTAIGGHADASTGAGLAGSVSTLLTWVVFKR